MCILIPVILSFFSDVGFFFLYSCLLIYASTRIYPFLGADGYFVLSLVYRVPLSFPYNTGLLIMNSFTLYLYWSIFIYFLFSSKNNFASYSNIV